MNRRLSQCEIKAGALVGFAFGPHVPAVPVDDPLDGGETDTRTREFRRRMQPLKGPEQFVRVLGIESGAVVADIERRDTLFVAALPDVDRRALATARELPRVLDQILKGDPHERS